MQDPDCGPKKASSCIGFRTAHSDSWSGTVNTRSSASHKTLLRLHQLYDEVAHTGAPEQDRVKKEYTLSTTTLMPPAGQLAHSSGQCCSVAA